MIEYNRWIDSYLSWIWNVFEYIKGCIEIRDNNRCTKIYIWNIHLDTIVEVICFSKACVLIRISIWNTFEFVLGLAIGRYVRYTGIWDEQSEKAMHCVLVQCLAFGSCCIAIESHVMHGWLRGWRVGADKRRCAHWSYARMLLILKCSDVVCFDHWAWETCPSWMLMNKICSWRATLMSDSMPSSMWRNRCEQRFGSTHLVMRVHWVSSVRERLDWCTGHWKGSASDSPYGREQSCRT